VSNQITVICKDDNELKKKVLPLLKETVFHVTSVNAYKGIVSDRAIIPNTDKKFSYTFPQSENSYGVKRGYICLFDLRNKNDDIIKKALMKFYFLNPYPNRNRSVFLILSPKLYFNLIDYTEAKKGTGYREMWIPHVECWYPGSIQLKDIDEVIRVTVLSDPYKYSR